MQGGGEPHGRRTERPSPRFLLTEILSPGEESGMEGGGWKHTYSTQWL